MSSIYGTSGNDTLLGTSDPDFLIGYAGNDLLSGDAEDDSLYGYEGNDTLDGGLGNDWLSGDAGNDVYLFGRGSGQDEIYDHFYSYDSGVNDSSDTIILRDLQVDDVSFSAEFRSVRENWVVIINIKGSTDRLVFELDDIEQIIFADGTAWGHSMVRTQFLTATSGDDYLVGDDTGLSDENNVGVMIDGGAGNDFISGTRKNDVLDGGTGNDTIYDGGYGGADTINGGAGDDMLIAWGQQASINGGIGNDTLEGGGGSTLDGGDGNDILKLFDSGNLLGGAGDDQLYAFNGSSNLTRILDGGLGSDTLYGAGFIYRFGRGDGQDVIVTSEFFIYQVSQLLQLSFKTGIAATEVSVVHTGADLVFSIQGTTDRITVRNFGYDKSSLRQGAVGQVQFTDGTSWDLATILAKSIAGSNANDGITGYNSRDDINGADGNDWIDGNAGDDYVWGGNGDDSLYGGDGCDQISGDAGADKLYGQDGDDILIGNIGNDNLSGDLGNDTLDGGANNDNLSGGAGDDVYLFGRGDGQDVIAAYYDSANNKLNELRFKAGVSAAEVLVRRSGTDLVLSIFGSNDKITVSLFFYGNDPVNNPYNPLQRITFADGTSWDVATIQAKLPTRVGSSLNDTLSGTTANDVLDAGSGNDVLTGLAADDVLLAGSGADTLIGGVGNDTLFGQSGSDVYQFARGDGQDSLYEADTTLGNTDVLLFGAAINPDQLWFSRLGNNLEVSVIGTDDKVTIGNWYSGSGTHVEQFKTATGKTLLDSKVDVLVAAMAGFAPPVAGQTTLPTTYQNALTKVIAANWQ